MAAEPIYLDQEATTPLVPKVVEAMLPFLREHHGNPSGGHVYAQRARAAVERARAQVAALLGCEPDEIVAGFGGTKANNLAIRGVVELAGARRHLLTSTVEHPATAQPLAYRERHGCEVTRVPVGAHGQVSAGRRCSAATTA